MSEPAKALTSGRLLARNSVWNLAGMATPALVGVVALPALISGMGTDRFGLLTIIWMGVGYFSLFDLGMGRALTKLVSERIGTNDTTDLRDLIWTALTLLTAMGVVGSLTLVATSGSVVRGLLNVDPSISGEAITAFRILALGIPVVVATVALVGLLEAYQRFAAITLVRIPLGVLTFGGPLVVVQFTPSLAWATAALLLSRIVAFAAYFVLASRAYDELREPARLRRRHVRPLVSFGGWLTVTNMVGPLMTYLDRLFVGAVLNMTAVAYYVTPYEVLSRLQMLPQSLMGVAFPAMSTAHAGDRRRLHDIFSSSGRIVTLSMLPVTAALFLFAPEGLELWVGAEFREASTPVVYWLAAGWTVNTLARPSFTILQSVGRPDLVAKTHLGELVPYLAMLWIATQTFGIAGTAAAWTARIVIDTLILNHLAGRVIPELKKQVHRIQAAVAFLLVGFGWAWLLQPLPLRLALLAVVWTSCALGLRPLWRRLRGRLASSSRSGPDPKDSRYQA